MMDVVRASTSAFGGIMKGWKHVGSLPRPCVMPEIPSRIISSGRLANAGIVSFAHCLLLIRTRRRYSGGADFYWLPSGYDGCAAMFRQLSSSGYCGTLHSEHIGDAEVKTWRKWLCVWWQHGVNLIELPSNAHKNSVLADDSEAAWKPSRHR